MRKSVFAYAETKVQTSCTVTMQLINAFVLATYIVQSLYFLILKLQTCSHLPRLNSPVCVGPGRKPEDMYYVLQAWLKGIKAKIQQICYMFSAAVKSEGRS